MFLITVNVKIKGMYSCKNMLFIHKILVLYNHKNKLLYRKKQVLRVLIQLRRRIIKFVTNQRIRNVYIGIAFNRSLK